MDDLDRMLALMRAQPLPGALESLDGPVMAGLTLSRERQAERKALGLAYGVAALVGLGGGLSGSHVEARAAGGEAAGLLALPAAAPSRLLTS